MATLTELQGLFGNDDLLKKTEAAIIKKANDILNLPAPTALQITWAKSAFQGPAEIRQTIWRTVLAANAGASVAAIASASDALIESAVNDAVDKLFTVTGV